MKKLHMIGQYLKYLIFAKNRHGIHSPFVYKFLDEVLYDKAAYPDYHIVEKEVEKLKHNHSLIETTDFASGNLSGGYGFRKRRISEIASTAGITVRHGRLLYRVVKYFKPVTMLEMGTSLGISTMYQAKGNPEAEFTGMEGCFNISSYTRKNLEKVNCQHVVLKIGPFIDTLPEVLSHYENNLYYAFIDGDHTYEGTMNYFEQIKKHINPNSILIFHDIHWSPEMGKAWNEIMKHPDVKITLDLFYMGIVFFRQELSKQDFIIRY
ncbi:MAG: class I SAM-dependent methyltransferase [Lentimicrobium sp.]|nr:class I SAM-dependent methyltransferase [Lentimicrobium sp.]